MTEAFFTCNITGQRNPIWVSIVDRKCAAPTSRLRIHDSTTGAGKSREHTFTVCVAPLWQYDNITQLVSTIETNRALGAEKFIVYNVSTGPRVNSALQTYIHEGIVDVLPWNIELHSVNCPTCLYNPHNDELHYNGQNGAVNDCMYRYRGRSKFLVITDLDEILVPKNNKKWAGLMRNLPYAPSYRFRSSLFKPEFPDSPNCSDTVLKYGIEPLQKMFREEYIFKHGLRPKSIIRPEEVDLMGIHYVFWFRDKNSTDFMVNSSLALISHYKPGWEGQDYPKILDSTIEQHKEQILNNVRDRWKIICDRKKSYCVQNVPVLEP